MSYSNRQLFIAKNGVNYGASLTSTTAETATNPANLRAGAIGLFAVTSTGYSLIATGTTDKTIAGIPQLVIAVGTVSGVPIVSSPISGRSLQVYLGKSYLAPVKQVIHLFYDGTLGSGVPVSNSSDFAITLVNRSKQNYPHIPRFTSAGVTPASGNTSYTVAVQAVNAFNARTGVTMLAEIVSNGTRTAFAAGTGSATAIKVTNGSTAVIYTDGSGTADDVQTAITVGMFVKIQGTLYKVAAATVNGFTLDRAYLGATEEILFTDADSGTYTTTEPTLVGIRLTGDTAGEKHEIGLQGLFEGGLITYTTAPTIGSGSYAEVKDAEAKANYMSRAYAFPGSDFPEVPASEAVVDETYDILTLTHEVSQEDMSAQNASVGFAIHAQIALPVGTDYSSTLISYLNTWAASTPGKFANVSV